MTGGHIHIYILQHDDYTYEAIKADHQDKTFVSPASAHGERGPQDKQDGEEEEDKDAPTLFALSSSHPADAHARSSSLARSLLAPATGIWTKWEGGRSEDK